MLPFLLTYKRKKITEFSISVSFKLPGEKIVWKKQEHRASEKDHESFFSHY